MGLKIHKYADGSFRPTWFGRISVKGRRRDTNLNVPIAGIVPVDESGNVRLSWKGDKAFECSRKAAQKAFDAWRRETQKDPAELQRKARKALNEAETERVLDCARDTEIYPLVVAAACTGMRIGDVCNMKWSDVDLNAGLIDCVTAKTGVRVTIPILGRLAEVLNEHAPVPGDGTPPSPYVFPAAQSQYARNKNRIFQAVKPVFARAVFGDVKPEADVGENGEMQRELAEVIDGAGFTDYKRSRLMDVYARFKAGERPVDIAAVLNVKRSQVSMDLRDIEKLTGETLRPMAAKSARRKNRLELMELTRKKRGGGQRAASIYGWHSFRHTFVVMALKAGVPVEDVRRIVGHGEAETTLENYYNPEKKHAVEAMRKRMEGRDRQARDSAHAPRARRA